ncbi:MAG: glycine cleavage system aminomethyltransferase GcvT [Casimicrobiaceae bacterium]
MLKQTPLNAEHRASGARMVDFGGWDMPVNYGSQLDEHHAVRRDAGMFDVSHMRVVDLAGAAEAGGTEGARGFLRYALANNVDKLQERGRALYSCLLNPDGGVLDDLIVYFVREDLFRVVLNAATADRDIEWLRKLLAQHAPQLTLTSRSDLAINAVQGPNARAKVWQAIPGSEVATAEIKPFTAVEANTDFGDLFIARTGYTGEDGFELIVPAARAESIWRALAAAGVKLCGLGARDTLRLEAGMNLYGQEMDESTSPLASGLGWTVDLAGARDFVGKGALMGKSRSQQLTGLLLLDRGGVLRAHQSVLTVHGDGEITSGTFSPTLGQSIALARLPAAAAVGEIVHVVIRDKKLAARIVKPPFVRNGRVLVS